MLLGRVRTDMGEYSLAEEALLEARAILPNLQMPVRLIECDVDLGGLYSTWKTPHAKILSRKYATESLQAASSTGETRFLAEALACLARIEIDDGNVGAGLDNAQQLSGSALEKNPSASQTLSALVPGSYTLTPASITQPGTYVDSIFAANPTTATVNAGAAATTTIGYAQLPGSGKLWVPFTTSIGGYAEAQLASGTSQPPAIAFAGGDIGRLEALVFDKDGNL